MSQENVGLKDVGSERAVVAGLCQYGQEAMVDVSDIIDSQTFTTETAQLLYLCAENILTESTTIDIASIYAASNRMGFYNKLFGNKKDTEYIRAVFNFPIKKENIRTHAKRLAKLQFARKAQQVAKDIHDRLGKLTGDETIDHIMNIPETGIFDLLFEVNKGKEDGPVLLTEGADEVLQEILENPCQIAGIPTPWPHYNTAIGGGIRRKTVHLIAARPKAGKTTIAKDVALHCALNLNIPILMLDTEMGRDDQLFRTLAGMSGVNTGKIETGQFGENVIDTKAVLDMLEKLKGHPYFWYKDIFGKPFPEVLSIIRRWIVQQVGYDEQGDVNDCLVIYDYFKLMSETQIDQIQEYQALGFQLSTLTDFAKEFDFPCLAFVQLNREEDISQSDRLRWFASSTSKFLRKDAEQMRQDGSNNGNRKLLVEDARFGPGLVDDHIDMQLNGDISTLSELGLHSAAEARRSQTTQGFQVPDTDDDEEDTVF